MTGGEIAAAAAAGKAVKAALGEDEDAKKSLNNAAADTPGFTRAAALSGQRMAAHQQAVLNLVRPIYRMLGVSREYFEHGQFDADFTEKTQAIPEEHASAPRPSVAGPAMEGLGWSLDEPSLKEMYLNLLAAAVDGRRQDQAHPSFAEIIKQLTPEEATFLNGLFPMLDSGSTPIAKFRLFIDSEDELKGYRDLTSHALPQSIDRNYYHNSIAIWIDNWIRLGLVHVSYDEFRVGDEAYDWAETSPLAAAFRAAHEKDEGKIAIVKGILSITSFGSLFKLAIATPQQYL